MTLFSNYTNFGTIALLILGLTLFALLCPWRNLPTNLDTLLKSLWRLSGPVAVTWAIFVLVLIGTTAYTILLLVHHLGTVDPNTDHLRQIILAIPVLIAALAGLIALPVTLIRLHYTRRQTLAEEEGLITDRINSAVLGLGAEKTVKVTEEGQVIERTEPNIEVRIGAILALGRIAQKNLDVHIQIMEILCEYLQNNCFWVPNAGLQTYENLPVDPSILPRADIQRAVKVLGAKSPEQMRLEDKKKYRIFLKNCDFSHVDFHQLNFIGATFTNCVFHNAVATDVNFRGARFLNCNFDFIDFIGSDLTGVTLNQAIFRSKKTSFTLPMLAKGLIALNCDLTAVEFLWPEIQNDVFSSGDTKWGIPDLPKFTRERENAFHKIDLGYDVDPETLKKTHSSIS